MSDYITLLGSEEVGRAGAAMKSAAFTIAQAANQIDASNAAVIQQLDAAVTRFENVVEKLISALQGSRVSQPVAANPEVRRPSRFDHPSGEVTQVVRSGDATVGLERVVDEGHAGDETA